MKLIPDKSVNLIFADLPYGQTARNKWDTIIPYDALWEQYERVITDNGSIVLFANGMFTAELMVSNKKLWKYNLVWDKVLVSGFLNANRMPLRVHEDMCVFYKKQPTYNPQKVEGKKSHSVGKNARDNSTTDYGLHKRVDNRDELGEMKHPKSILTFSKPHPSIALHPTQKSLEVCEWVINTFTNEGDIVLDNTSGVSTTGVASEKNNRRWINIELDKGEKGECLGYCDKAVGRFKDLI
jgi:site-specific DNA-methyltransferase (adenine-specific)